MLASYCCVCHQVMSEVLPTNIRSKGFSLFVGVSWLMNLIISLTTLR